jgi:hypothetical protein
MRWVHDLVRFEALAQAEQERVIGRTKPESVELSDEEKPATAHIARVEIEDEHGSELEIYRRSVPYGTLAEHGLYFVAFAADRTRYDRMLARIFGVADGTRDRLTDFSRPATGAFYFAPPLSLLGMVDTPVLGESELVLQTIPLFALCTARQLRFIASRAHTREFPTGSTLCTEGERGGDFFVIIAGSAEVRREGTVLRRVGPGEFFGEIGLIDDQPRTATVQAITPLRCVVLGGEQFRDVLEQNVDITKRILDAVTRRLRASVRAEPQAALLTSAPRREA